VSGWGTSILYLYRAFYGLADEIPPVVSNVVENGGGEAAEKEKEKEKEKRLMPLADREASLRTVEFYFNLVAPYLFLVLYIFSAE
jgi:hypothetical protein